MVHQVNKTIHQVELEVSLYTLHMPINTVWTVNDVKVGFHQYYKKMETHLIK